MSSNLDELNNRVRVNIEGLTCCWDSQKANFAAEALSALDALVAYAKQADALVARVTEAEQALEAAKDFSYRSHRDRAERAEAALADARNALERIAEPFASPSAAQGLAREVLVRLDGSQA